MFEKNFIDACLGGDIELECIDDYVEYWHTHDTKNELQEFLGMADSEYDAWAKYGDRLLRDILRCRVNEIEFELYPTMTNEERIAARSCDPAEIEKLKHENS